MGSSTPLRVGVIGAGHWGPNIIRLVDGDSRGEVVAVADRDEARLDRLGGRFPEARLTTDADAVLTASDVDAVVVVTPTSTHEHLARRALEHGKHVLVEKPITNSAAGAEVLCELAEARGLTLMVGHVFLFNAGVRAAKDHIDGGALGRPQYISMLRTNLGPIRADVNA